MNRGKSSESLSSNGSSSSPTDFTSDDEISNEGFMTGNSSLKTNKSDSSKVFAHLEQRISMLKSDVREPTNYNNIFYNRVNMYRQPTSSRKSLTRPNDNNLSPKYERNINSFLDDISGSCNPSNSSLSNSLSSPSSSSHHVFVPSDNHLSIDNINTHRSLLTPQMMNLTQRELRQIHSGVRLDDENNENLVGSSVGLNENDDDLDDADLFGRVDSQIDSTVSNFTSSVRGINSITVRMCARLVECRNLIEAIEFVEQNRVLIDDLTQIVTRDAPAFRNYNMTNYQIDYSIKESFNSDFWLDREPIVTTADGNCQYHAVSLSLTGSELYTPEVRLATAVAVIDNREWFDSMLKLIDRGTVLDLVHTIARNYSWGDETTLKAVAVAINRRIFLYTCNIGKKDYEMVKTLDKEELIDAFREKKYRGGTGIHTYADPLIHVAANNYIMLFHKSEHFIAVLPTSQHPTMFEPYNPIVPIF